MSTNLTQDTIKKIVTNPEVLEHLIKLQKKLKLDFAKHSDQYPEGLVEAVQESPNTTTWVKNVVIPKIHAGDEGLNDVLLEIEKEKNTLLSATKMQIVLDILESLPESLSALKEGVEEGEYDLEENIKNFEQEIPFKNLH